jgi:FkbM family methyltransferase
LTLNTAPYPRIRRLNGAVWSTTTRLSLGGHELGDWGAQFAAGDPSPEAAIPAWSVEDILRNVGWDRADLIKCDVEGAEREVFADRAARWHQDALCVTVETHDAWIPGCLAAVEACFDPAKFDRVWSGEVWAFVRRDSRAAALPPPVMLLSPPHARLPIELADVSEGIWGFMLFDEHSCQLHPNGFGEPPATLSVDCDLGGQRRFRAGAALPGKARSTVRFSVQLQDRTSGKRICGGEWVVAPGQQSVCEVALPPLHGRFRVRLCTEMAEAGSDSFHAWAHWIAPQFM